MLVREPGHRRRFRRGLVAVAGRNGNAERFGGLVRVVKEHLVKVAHSEKQKGALRSLFGVVVLFHHRGKFAHNDYFSEVKRFGKPVDRRKSKKNAPPDRFDDAQTLPSPPLAESVKSPRPLQRFPGPAPVSRKNAQRKSKAGKIGKTGAFGKNVEKNFKEGPSPPFSSRRIEV